jgi:hypothetical protein
MDSDHDLAAMYGVMRAQEQACSGVCDCCADDEEDAAIVAAWYAQRDRCEREGNLTCVCCAGLGESAGGHPCGCCDTFGSLTPAQAAEHRRNAA